MKYLFLSPYGVINDWRFAENQLQKTISLNNDVAIITCGSILKKSCVAIKAHTEKYKNNFFRKRICNRCISNQTKYSDGFKTFAIENYLEKNDYNLISKNLDQLNKDNFVNFKFENMELGKRSLFENMLIFKKNDLLFSDKQFLEIKNTIESLLIFVIAIKRISKEFHPDFVISQNGNYSLSSTFNNYFKQLGSVAYSWEASNHYLYRTQKLLISKNHNNFGLNSIKNNWRLKLCNNKVSKKNLTNVNSHFRTIINAKALRNFSKSYKKNEDSARDFFKIKEKKIALLNTSSWDEIIGTYILRDININKLIIFKSQEEWVQKCIKFFSNHKDISLIIRPHPRDFYNKNSNLMNYIKNLNDLPKNILINTPNDQISLYSILKDTNLVLNSWSTLGMEAGILNIPVISISDELNLYPKEIGYFMENENLYFQKIEQLILSNNEEFNLEQCKNFYNFLSAYLDYSNLNLDIKRNKFTFLMSRLFDKLSLPFINKGLQANFMGESKLIKKNNKFLNTFFEKKFDTLCDMRESYQDNLLNINDKDYIESFIVLSSIILEKNDNCILSRKISKLR